MVVIRGRLAAEAELALREKVEADKLASAAADRRTVFAIGLMATAGFIASALIITHRVGHSLDSVASGIHDVAGALRGILGMLGAGEDEDWDEGEAWGGGGGWGSGAGMPPGLRVPRRAPGPGPPTGPGSGPPTGSGSGSGPGSARKGLF